METARRQVGHTFLQVRPKRAHSAVLESIMWTERTALEGSNWRFHPLIRGTFHAASCDMMSSAQEPLAPGPPRRRIRLRRNNRNLRRSNVLDLVPPPRTGAPPQPDPSERSRAAASHGVGSRPLSRVGGRDKRRRDRRTIEEGRVRRPDGGQKTGDLC